MEQSRGSRRRQLVLSSLGLVAALLVGCGSSDEADTPAAPSGDSTSTTSKLPAAYAGKDKLVVASDATYPPMESLAEDGKTVVGFDADLAAELGKRLGTEVEVVNATFDAILPGLSAGKYDIGMSSFTATAEREQAFDMVSYFKAGTAYFTPAGSAPIASLSDLCGKTVAVQKGTTQVDQLTAQSGECGSGGAIKQLVFTDQNGVNLALSSGRAEVATADSPVAAYLVERSNGKFELGPEAYETAPYGIAVKKGEGLAEPVQEALEAIMADGTYTKMLEEWGLEAGAIEAPEINPASS